MRKSPVESVEAARQPGGDFADGNLSLRDAAAAGIGDYALKRSADRGGLRGCEAGNAEQNNQDAKAAEHATQGIRWVPPFSSGEGVRQPNPKNIS